MNIPQSQYLHSQNFNSKFVEFVWQFPEFDQDYQLIFITFEDGMVYQESGYIDSNGEYTNGHVEAAIIPPFSSLADRHISTNELQSLHQESLEFLR